MVKNSIQDDLLFIQKGLNEQVIPLIIAHRKRHYDRLTRLTGSLTRKLNATLKDETDFNKLLEVLNVLSTEVEKAQSNNSDSEFLNKFHEAVGSLQHEIPSKTSYQQDEQCFSPVESDSLYIRFGKFIKRSNREIKRTSHSVTSYFQRLVGKEIIARVPEQHEVRWIRVSRSISIELLEQFATLRHVDHAYYSKIASLLDDICDHGKDQIRREQDIHLFEKLDSELHTKKTKLEGDFLDIAESIVHDIINEIRFMGTFQESNQHFNTNSLNRREKTATQNILNSEINWRKNCEIHLSQLSIDIGIHQYNSLINNELADFKNKFHTTLEKNIIPVVDKTGAYLRKTADTFQATSSKSVRTAVFKKKLIETQKELESKLNDSFSKPITTVLQNVDLINDMEEALSRILLGDEILPDQAFVFKSKPLDNLKAITEHESINFRTELTTYIKNDVFRKLRKIPITLSSELEKYHADVDEVIQVSMVNVQLALELLDSDEKSDEDDKILSLIHDGLDRAAKRTSEIHLKAEKLVKTAENELNQAYDKYHEVCQNAMIDDNYLYIRSKNREALVISRAIDWRTRLNAKWLQFGDRMVVRYRLTVKFVSVIYTKLELILGFRKDISTDGYIQAGASEFLAETEQKLAELPLIYRRLFAEDALQEPRFFKGREATKQAMKESYEIWSRGHFSNLVMVGEKGSGKTSCMLILPELNNIEHPILRGTLLNSIWNEAQLIQRLSEILGIEIQSDKETFISEINAIKERKVVILEGFQNLFLRTINGFDALEAFLLILSQTSGNIFWMVTSSRYGWMYLNKIYQVAGYFSHIRTIDNLNSDTIEDIILSRHKVSGYDLNFIPSNDMISSRAFKKLETNPDEQQMLVRKTFFKALSSVSEGNISIAMQYWLRSIRNTGVDVIDIAPFSDVNVSLGDGFTNDDLFALAAIVQHDDLTESELAIVLNTNSQNSRLILSKLSSRAILLRRNDRYYLNQLLYRHIINVLKIKNILH